MNSNRIPESFRPLLGLASEACAGAEKLGAPLGLKQHDAAALRTDTQSFSDTQAAYLESRNAHTTARLAFRTADTAARALCGNVIDVLKTHLGRRWNSRWVAAGFTGHSLALPRETLPTLHQLLAYLEAHPEHETPSLQISVPALTAMRAAWVAASAAMATAHRAEVAAKRTRDEAYVQLRQRLSGLRSELTFLLKPTDGRWYDFGFHRPADGRMPEPVEELTVRPGAEGEAVATWSPSVRAENYRVMVRVEGSAAESRNVGLFSDTQVNIANLPRTGTVIIGVSARNRVGEARVTERPLTGGNAPRPTSNTEHSTLNVQSEPELQVSHPQQASQAVR